MIKRKFKSVKNILADNGYDDYYKEFEKRELTNHYKIFKLAINGKLKQEFDKIFESQGIKIVCDLQSWMYLKGTNIEYSDDMLNGGFKITNPNAERTCGCGTSFSV